MFVGVLSRELKIVHRLNFKFSKWERAPKTTFSCEHMQICTLTYFIVFIIIVIINNYNK